MSKIKTIQEIYSKLDASIAEASKVTSDNGVTPVLHQMSKSVYVEEDEVYKLYPLSEGYTRYLLYRAGVNAEVPIFLPCEVVNTYRALNAVIIKEKKVEVIPAYSKKELIDYCTKKGYNVNFLADIGLNFFQENNCGILNGETYIFDGIWNVYATVRKDLGEIRLQDGSGNVLISEDF